MMSKAKIDELVVKMDVTKMTTKEKAKALHTPMNKIERSHDMFENKFKNTALTYMNQKRFYGEGEIRINTSVEVNDDIYCTGFMAYLSDKIIRKTIDIRSGELKDSSDEDSEEKEDD